MPKVKSYSTPWLQANTPGFQLFEPTHDSPRATALSSSSKEPLPGPRRTIAKRGTQVFVAAGKEIRWADLAYLSDQWTANQERTGRRTTLPRHGSLKREESSFSTEDGFDFENAPGIRTIKTRCAEDIRQLIISPNSNYLAILTTHTVHICILPDPSHLTSDDTTPLNTKMFTLGPTTHVTSRSAVMSALWHPLGVNGTCLVTVTADAIVRVWEIDQAHRWSFDNPTTSIDLKRLADGTNLDQDFSASTTTTNKAFSPDSFEMEVAAATFASRGSGGWDPMTLWVAMREGDVYALCPLLPKQWAPPPTLIPSLAVSIVTTVASIEDDPEVSEYEKLLAQQQLEWMGEIDSQEPSITEGPLDEPLLEVYTRPSRPGIVPRLQGPLELKSNPDTGDDLDTLITDIMLIGKKPETEDLMMGEEAELDLDKRDQEGASISIVCLLSVSGQTRIYLDLDGVQAQWLPPKSKSRLARLLGTMDPPSLVAFQALDTMSPIEVGEESWPVFSADVASRYNFFVTHHAGIIFISLASWIFRLEKEISGESEAGTDFRIGMVVNSRSLRERIYAQSSADTALPLASAIALQDPDLGYFLLSATPFEPIALTFESPEADVAPLRQQSPKEEEDINPIPLEFYEPRPVFRPSHAFDQASSLPNLLERLRTSRYKTVVTQEVRLSPLTLSIFTDAHKVLSDETHRLGVAAAEVFRRCEVLQTELRQQVAKANSVKSRVDEINGAHREDGESDNAMYERRIEEARERQTLITKRLDSLRMIVGKATTRDLSAKERLFFEEVKSMNKHVSKPEDEDEGSHSQVKELWRRLDEAKNLQEELAGEAQSLNTGGEVQSPSSSEIRIPQDIRRTKLQQVQKLLSRETALVEAVTSRLERLQTTA